MLRRTMMAALAALVVLAAGTAVAQMPTVGAYNDAMGMSNVVQPVTPGQGEPVIDVSVYIVLFAEDFANAVSYSLTVPGLGVDIFDNGFTPVGAPNNFADTAISGESILVRTGLAGCQLGFAGAPVLVGRHDFKLLWGRQSRMLTVGPDPRENPNAPQYSRCTGTNRLVETATVDAQLIAQPVPNEENSWGSVKALYGN